MEETRPVVVFDGDCGFCRRWIVRWQHRTGGRVEFQPFQNPEITARFPSIRRADFAKAVHLIEPDGRVSSGAEAVFRLMAMGRGSVAPTRRGTVLGASLVRAYDVVPGVRAVSEAAYRFVADHRPLFTRLTMWLWGSTTERPTFAVSAWCFRRLLGLVYLSAFWSLSVQILGLIGHEGVLPAATYMEQAREWASGSNIGLERFRELPTIFWLSASDAWLRGVCLGGAALSVMLILGLMPLLVLPLLWFFYLSLSVVGREFLSYQWDTLLIETGFLAIFIAPAAVRDRLRGALDPPRLGVWLLLWLMVRLVVGSGAIKLVSGDPTWRGLTALSFHYETQPIPTPVAWYAHQLPLWFHRASTILMLGIELVAPWLVLFPRRPRIVALVPLVGLQALFALFGNYAFFNVLSALPAVLLLDDVGLERWMPAGLRARSARSPAAVPPLRPFRLQSAVLVVVAIVTVPVSLVAFSRSAGLELGGVPVFSGLTAFVEPYRTVNTYGLFAVMTTSRPEIVVEGSDDGTTWQAYEFKYKAGQLDRQPPWVAPHQPRLDWQMWFAALGRYESERWFQQFCRTLLEGSPPVLSLLSYDPFTGRPPRYVRGVLYRYRFTEVSAGDAWWRRERLGDYSPTLSLSRQKAFDQ